MRRGLLSLATLTFLSTIGGLSGTAGANENATIWNNSNQPVFLQVKWSVFPFASPPFTLPPGQRNTISVPNGAAVSIVFNSTPANTLSPKYVLAPIATAVATTPGPGGVQMLPQRDALRRQPLRDGSPDDAGPATRPGHPGLRPGPD